jgi:DNA-binding response OmpR family regulator
LLSAGYDVADYYCVEDMDEQIPLQIPDIYVIDINLPGEDGLALAKRIRAGNPKAGIVIFSARTTTKDRVFGYDQGADLYLTKPVDPDEFLSAISALGRRLKPETGASLRLQVKSLTLEGPTATVRLSHSEAMLLSQFATAQAGFLDYLVVAERFFGSGEINRSSLDARISYLRKKLIEAGAPSPVILAVHKQGYRLCADIALG